MVTCRRLRLTVLAAVALLGSLAAQNAGPANNSGADIFRLYRDKGRLAYDDGNYEQAEKYFREYFEAAIQLKAPAWIVDAGVRLTQTLLARDRAAEAETLVVSVAPQVAAVTAVTPDSGNLTPEQQARLTYWRAETLRRQQKYTEALPLYSEVLRGPVTEFHLPARLGIAQTYLATGDQARAERLFRGLIEQEDDSIDSGAVALGLSEALFAQQKFGDVAQLVRDNLARTRGTRRERLAMLYVAAQVELGEPMKAYEFFRETFAGSTTFLDREAHVLVVRRLGQALAQAGDYDEALNVFDRMLPLLNSEAPKKTVLLDISETAAAAGDRDLAIRQLQTYLKLYPDDPRLYELRMRIAEFSEATDRPNDALNYYNQVYTQAAADMNLRWAAAMAMGRIYREQKQSPDKAIEIFQAASELTVGDPQRAEATWYAAETQFAQQNYPDAAFLYAKVAVRYADSKWARPARYKQAVCHLKFKRYGPAADTFAKFLEEYPKDTEFGQDALFYKGYAEHEAERYGDAVTTFTRFVDTYPDSPRAPEALLRASAAAAATDQQSKAISALTQLIDKYPQAEESRYGLYRRAFLRLSYGQYSEAIDDSYAFLKVTDSPELAAQVNLWLGDHFANQGRYGDAEKHFLVVADRGPYKGLTEAATALYEAAKNAYNEAVSRNYDAEDLRRALVYLDRLAAEHADAPKRLQAQARFLRGDILSVKGDFAEAAKLFAAAAESVPKTPLYYAALGRLGECYYTMAPQHETNQRREALETALAQFRTIVDERAVHGDPALEEKARYRMGRTLELLDRPAEAVEQYHEIFVRYRAEAIRLNWYYFSRAGFRLAGLYAEQHEYTQAIQVYRVLARSDIPTAGEAAARMKELEAQYRAGQEGG